MCALYSRQDEVDFPPAVDPPSWCHRWLRSPLHHHYPLHRHLLCYPHHCLWHSRRRHPLRPCCRRCRHCSPPGHTPRAHWPIPSPSPQHAKHGITCLPPWCIAPAHPSPTSLLVLQSSFPRWWEGTLICRGTSGGTRCSTHAPPFDRTIRTDNSNQNTAWRNASQSCFHRWSKCPVVVTSYMVSLQWIVEVTRTTFPLLLRNAVIASFISRLPALKIFSRTFQVTRPFSSIMMRSSPL